MINEQRINKAFQELLNGYFESDEISLFQNQKREVELVSDFNSTTDSQIIAEFLTKSCGCGRNCQEQFTAEELLDSRRAFHALASSEKNYYILGQLRLLSKRTEHSMSARSKSIRQRQKFEYQINADRPVCRNMFLFYHGETIKRLKRLQESFIENPIQMPVHGNKGNKPVNAYSLSDRESVKLFIINISENHGLPDPGRDVRKGKGRLRSFFLRL